VGPVARRGQYIFETSEPRDVAYGNLYGAKRKEKERYVEKG